MNTDSQPQVSTIPTAANIPLLPAHTLTRPAPVTPEAPAAPKNRDTVTFVTSEGKTQEGTVLYVSWMAITGVTTYYIKSGNKTHACALKDILPGKMPAAPLAPIMDADTAPVLEERISAKVAHKDILDTLRAINEASLIWQHTRDNEKDEDKTKKLSDAHDALYIAYLESLGVPQKASASSEKGVSSAVEDIQRRDTSEWPEIAPTPVLEGEPFAPVNTTNTHPLALSQPGSRWHGTDWDVVAAKRQQQYADKRAAIEAMNGKYQVVKPAIDAKLAESIARDNQMAFKRIMGGAS